MCDYIVLADDDDEEMVETDSDGPSTEVVRNNDDIVSTKGVESNDEEEMLPAMVDTDLDIKATLIVLPKNIMKQWREQIRTWVRH